MSFEDVLKAYGAAWGETDEDARRDLLSKCWAKDGVYQDPMGEARGREALVQHIGGMLDQMPGARIELTSAVSTHHDKLHFEWALMDASGAVVVKGVDFGVIGDSGKLASITGFFDTPAG